MSTCGNIRVHAQIAITGCTSTRLKRRFETPEHPSAHMDAASVLFLSGLVREVAKRKNEREQLGLGERTPEEPE